MATDEPDVRHGPNLTGVMRCPHCRIARPLLALLNEFGLHGIPEKPDYFRSWSVYRCTNCNNLVMARSFPVESGLVRTDAILDVERIWPQSLRASDELPASAKKYLDQAYDTLSAPDAATVMAASAVDSMLKAIGYGAGSLYARIDQAVTDHKLTEGMGQWAHQVRLDANDVRHADASNPHVTPDQARQAVEFAAALGEFLFVLTARVNRGLKATGTATPTP